ncbi:MAG TPA: MBL fold metallo-hydrolase, partial [Solirubrobacteraceae bacterium]
MDLSLLFAGTAGSVPTQRRGLPATLLRAGGDRLLFDCGEGTQRQLLRSESGLPEIDAVFITHFHADHWLGLPGMLKTFDLRDRDVPLEIYGPPGLRRIMDAVIPLVGRTLYPLEIVELDR